MGCAGVAYRLGMVGRCYTKKHQYFCRVHIEALMKTPGRSVCKKLLIERYFIRHWFPNLPQDFRVKGVGSRYFGSAPTDDTLLGLAAPWPPLGDPTEINKRNRSERRHAQHLPSWVNKKNPVNLGFFHIFPISGVILSINGMFFFGLWIKAANCKKPSKYFKTHCQDTCLHGRTLPGGLCSQFKNLQVRMKMKL